VAVIEGDGSKFEVTRPADGFGLSFRSVVVTCITHNLGDLFFDVNRQEGRGSARPHGRNTPPVRAGSAVPTGRNLAISEKSSPYRQTPP